MLLIVKVSYPVSTIRVQVGTLATHPLLRAVSLTKSFLALPSCLLSAQMDTQKLLGLCMFNMCLNRAQMGLQRTPSSAFRH